MGLNDQVQNYSANRINGKLTIPMKIQIMEPVNYHFKDPQKTHMVERVFEMFSEIVYKFPEDVFHMKINIKEVDDPTEPAILAMVEVLIVTLYLLPE